MNVELAVIVKPGSKSPGIVISEDDVIVRVRAPAVEGRATEAARRAIADALHVSRSAVTLLRGATSRYKSFAIKGITKTEALRRLGSE